MVGFALAGLLNPTKLARWGITSQYMIILGLVIFTAALGAMAMQDLTFGIAFGCEFVSSVGNGWFEGLAIKAVQLELDAKDIGLANSAQFGPQDNLWQYCQ